MPDTTRPASAVMIFTRSRNAAKGDNSMYCMTPDPFPAQRLVKGRLRQTSAYPASTILEKWFPLRGERAHSLKLFCMYDKRFEISKTK